MPILLSLLLAAAGPAVTPATSPLAPACQDGKLRPAKAVPRAGPHKLNQEPPARQLYAVLRTEGGCTRPVYVNERVIGDTAPR